MTEPKWKNVIATAEKYRDADQTALAALCHCDIRTVDRALKRKEAEHLIKSVKETVIEAEDDVDLLLRQLRKLCSRESPDIRALNCLASVLDKTGVLEPRGSEQEWNQTVTKLSVEELLRVSSGNPLTEKSQEEDPTESLYQ